MKEKEIASYCIDSLLEAGADKAQFGLGKSEKHEMNLENGEMSLIRTTFDTSLYCSMIKDQRQGNVSINKTDKDSLDHAVKDALEMAKTSEPDPAHDISSVPASKRFSVGREAPDLDRMYDSLRDFADQVKKEFPKIILQQVILDFTHSLGLFQNSNGVSFESTKGMYHFSAVFAAAEGGKTSSMNYSGFSTRELNKDLLEYGTLRTLLEQSSEQIETTPIQGKFVGDVIFTPDCLGGMIDSLVNITLRDGALIAGHSIFKDKLNEPVTHPKFSLHAMPISEEIANGYFHTGDGFEAENSTIIDKGVLKTFLLSLYGSRKTGLKRAVNSGGCYVVDPGDKSLQEMVKGVQRGILAARFSGGHPSTNGEFSGVAKNSYYIENGRIMYPISETMISGNLEEVFRNIIDISRERVNFGHTLLPWMAVSGVTISGK